MNPTIIAHLVDEITIPADSTVSRTLQNDPHSKTVLFAFAAGQELSEHTASMPAIIQFVKGEAEVTLGEHSLRAVTGTWIHMPAHLPHSIRATRDTVMVLTLIKTPKP